MRYEYDLSFEGARDTAVVAQRASTFDIQHGSTEDLQELMRSVEQVIDESKPGPPREVWEIWISAARCFVAQKMLIAALRSSEPVADAKVRADLLREELSTLIESSVEQVPEDDAGWNKLLIAMLGLPLPALYWRCDRSWENLRLRQKNSAAEENDFEDALPTVTRVIVDIDDAPLVSPQEVRPATIYSIRLEAHFARWSDRIQSVKFLFGTTLASSQYSLSDFAAESVSKVDESTFSAVAMGSLVFPYAQNNPFSPVVLAVNAVLTLHDGESITVRAVGHDQLQFRIRQTSQTLLSSGWPRMDAHLHDLIQKLEHAQPRVKDEFDSLLPLLEGLAAVLGTFAQGGVLKGRTDVHEAEFQDDVLRILRSRLGADVQEGPNQAGGITDIRFRGSIVELKVEKSISDRKKLFAKYASQSTQYAGVEARSVSLLLILDLTPKSKPPGDLRNDIMLDRVETHGRPDVFPSWAFMFVVQGNTVSPSSYSK